MSDNVGLSTPRGSGTSGHVQRNLAFQKPRDFGAPYPRDLDSLRHKQRQPDKGLLEHDRKREVEVKVFALRDQLEDEGCAPCHAVFTGDDALADVWPAVSKKTRSTSAATPCARS